MLDCFNFGILQQKPYHIYDWHNSRNIKLLEAITCPHKAVRLTFGRVLLSACYEIYITTMLNNL